MIIRKVCQECRKLLGVDKFNINSRYADGLSSICRSCEEDTNIEKNNFNLNLKVMPTLKEKRDAAAAAAEAAEVAKTTGTAATPKAAAKVTTPVAKPKATTAKSAAKVEEPVAPKVAEPKTPKAEEPAAVTEPKVKPIGKQGIVTPRKKSEKRKIDQVDLATGKVIATHDTVMSAAAALKKDNDAGIRATLAGRAKGAFGFDWQFSKELLYPELAAAEAAAAKEADKAAAKAAKEAEKATKK